MAETKRYDVGPEHGYAHATTIKLTEEQARAKGLTEKNVSKTTTTADSLAKRDRYEEAMTSQERMRATEAAAAAQEAEAPDADGSGTADAEAAPAKSKKRGAPAAG